jgi:hypothetical protein
MAITNYSELKTAVANWINRDSLTALIPDFIALAEIKTWRKLRLPVNEVVTEINISATGTITIPTDYLELKSMVLLTNPERELERRPYYELRRRQGDTGIPRYFARKDQQWVFGPLPDGTYAVEVYYYKFLDALSDANTDNYLVDNAPDILLYGALWQGYLYLKDNENASRWKGRWLEAMNEVMEMNQAADWSTTPLTVREVR